MRRAVALCAALAVWTGLFYVILKGAYSGKDDGASSKIGTYPISYSTKII